MRTKHYTSFNDDLKAHFGLKVYKIAIETGFTCPTRDGTKGTEGCHYCSDAGAFYLDKTELGSVKDQIESGKTYYRKRVRAEKFLAYFQSYTPTYGDISTLRAQYEEAIRDPDIVGLSVCTRPDCLSDDVLDLLAEMMTPRYHWLELGLQTAHDRTLEQIGRGHTYEEFLSTFHKAKQRGLRICAHVILGLPGETESMMQETIQKLVALDVDGIKFHHLHILKDSVFEKLYREGSIKVFTLDEYKDLIGKLLPMIPSKTVIHRLSGDAPKQYLIAPDWLGGHKIRVLQAIEKHLKDNHIFQGSLQP